jgi:hypothetical protein
MRKPEFQDFGITPEEFKYYSQQVEQLASKDTPFLNFMSACVIIGTVGGITALSIILGWGVKGAMGAFLLGCFAAAFLVYIPSLIAAVISSFKQSGMSSSPLGRKMKLYQAAESAYQVGVREAEKIQRDAELARQRTLEQHWMSLSGPQFERELGVYTKG